MNYSAPRVSRSLRDVRRFHGKKIIACETPATRCEAKVKSKWTTVSQKRLSIFLDILSPLNFLFRIQSDCIGRAIVSAMTPFNRSFFYIIFNILIGWMTLFLPAIRLFVCRFSENGLRPLHRAVIQNSVGRRNQCAWIL